MRIVIGDFYKLIVQHTIRPTVAESVDVVTISHRRSSDTDSNDNPSGVIIDKWNELEVFSPILLM